MNIEEVEEPKKYENYHAKPVSDPFKTIADHRKVPQLPRKLNIEEVEEPETTKIHKQNRARPPRPARNYENSHTKRTCKHETTKIATNSVRPLDLATRPFTTTVRTPSVNHTVWEKNGGFAWYVDSVDSHFIFQASKTSSDPTSPDAEMAERPLSFSAKPVIDFW